MQRGSLLPSHGAAKLEAGSKSNKDLEAEYHAADTKLHDIEEELDVLTHSVTAILWNTSGLLFIILF